MTRPKRLPRSDPESSDATKPGGYLFTFTQLKSQAAGSDATETAEYVGAAINIDAAREGDLRRAPRDEITKSAPGAELHSAGDADWTDALSPTGASLDALLAEVAAQGARRRREPPSAIRSVADTIAGFCNERAVSDSEGWQVRIVLREDVLPATTLELGVSPHWLQVRFLTGDAAARRLLYEHRDALRTLLAAAQSKAREIAIELD